MKKLSLYCILTIMIFAILAGCADSAANHESAEDGGGTGDVEDDGGIAFEYFYRGFTPITDENDITIFESVPGTLIIKTQSDLQDFMSTYCPGIAYFVADFSEESLIAISDVTDASPSYNVSSDIKTIRIVDNRVEVTFDEKQNQSERIYALNTGVTHWYVNIIKVNRDDLPSGTADVYEK